MTRKCLVRSVSFVLTAWSLSAHSAAKIDNIRVAHPSLSASVVCLIIVRLPVRDGVSDAKILQPMIDEMKAATKTQRDMKFADVFDFSFARKANEELKASGWKP
jgi:hypothetical protein